MALGPKNANGVKQDREGGADSAEDYRASVEGDRIEVVKDSGTKEFYWEESVGYVLKQTPDSTLISWFRVTIDPEDSSGASGKPHEIASVERAYFDEVKNGILRIDETQDHVQRRYDRKKLFDDVFSRFSVVSQ